MRQRLLYKFSEVYQGITVNDVVILKARRL